MARNSIVLRDLFHIIFVWSFLNALEISNGTETDIYCLKSIKDSLEDPYNRLKDSWDFSNKTEGSICRFTGVECWHPDESKVLNIKLSGMMLRGQFPRGIKNCSSLIGLDLSGNELSGPLPFDIDELLPYIISLELSANKFSGEIPKSIGNCTYLNVLKLDNNQLIGEIPPEMSKLVRLNLLDVSNNQLSGSVPVFDSEFITAERFANNKDLCGRPLKPCPSWIFDFSFKSGFLVGYVFSTVSLLVIFFSQYAAFMIKKKTAKKMTLSKEGTKNAHKEADQFIQLQTKGLLQEGSKKVLSLTLLKLRNLFQFHVSSFSKKYTKPHEVFHQNMKSCNTSLPAGFECNTLSLGILAVTQNLMLYTCTVLYENNMESCNHECVTFLRFVFMNV